MMVCTCRSVVQPEYKLNSGTKRMELEQATQMDTDLLVI